MKFAVIGARVLLGLIFVVFGLHGFFQFSFIPAPEMNEAAGSFMGALVGTGYFMIAVKLVELVSGLMILTGRFLPLGLILLAPVSVSILLFHTFLDQAGLGMAIFLVAMQLFLAWSYRDSFSGVLQANPKPTGQG
jgi:putative oxidoreductase